MSRKELQELFDKECAVYTAHSPEELCALPEEYRKTLGRYLSYAEIYQWARDFAASYRNIRGTKLGDYDIEHRLSIMPPEVKTIALKMVYRFTHNTK